MEGKNNFGDFFSPKFFGKTAGLAPEKKITINPEIAKGFAFSQNKNYVRSKKRWAQRACNVRQNHRKN